MKVIECFKKLFSCKKVQDLPAKSVAEEKKVENYNFKLHFLTHQCDCYLPAQTLRELLNIATDQWNEISRGVPCEKVNEYGMVLTSGPDFGMESIYNMNAIKMIANKLPNVDQRLLSEIEYQYKCEMRENQFALIQR